MPDIHEETIDKAGATNWDESKHPRGRGAQGGQFTEKPGGPEDEKEKIPVLTPRSEKAKRASKAYVSANYEEQKIADEQERIISKALGLPRTPNNHEWDLLTDKLGIEVKTIIKQKNNKITMSKEARQRKLDSVASRGKKFRAMTLVADKRGGGTRYYVREGVGSFRIPSMQQVTLQELKEILGGAK